MDKARKIEKKYVPNAVCWPVAHRCSAAVDDCRRRSAAVGGGWRAEGAAAGRWGGEGAAGKTPRFYRQLVKAAGAALVDVVPMVCRTIG